MSNLVKFIFIISQILIIAHFQKFWHYAIFRFPGTFVLRVGVATFRYYDLGTVIGGKPSSLLPPGSYRCREEQLR